MAQSFSMRNLLKKKPEKYSWCGAAKLISSFLIPFLFISCEAPRSNPLDPMNAINSNLASLSGTVQTLSLPYSAIPDTRVYWQPGNNLIKTDADGNFLIQNTQPVDGLLIFEKDGYKTETINVIWEGAKNLSKEIHLNKIPVLDSISIYTVIINQTLPQPAFELNIVAKIKDSDNDIDSVYVENKSLSVIEQLNLSDKTYQATLTSVELNVDDLEKTIGQEFLIIVKDIFDNQFIVGSEKVTRVIKNQVSGVSPANNTIVDSLPEFKWDRFLPGYSFNYTIEIYTNDIADAQLVTRIMNISSDSTSYKIDQPLPKKEYYWVIWIVDEFYNRSRSKPETFIVQ